MTLVAVAFVILVLMGMPVAFAIGISGLVFFLQNPDLPQTIPAQVTVTLTQNFTLLAVPLFIIAGNFLNRSGLTEELLRLASVLTGRLKGGLAQVSLTLSMLMGGVSGSAIADAAMQARMIGGEMERRGMSKGFVAAVLSFGSLLTPVVPPGLGMIIYGTIGQVSIGRLFAAGFLPALLLWVAMAVTVTLVARRRGYAPERAAAPTMPEVFSALRGGIWALIFPIILLVGLRAGVFTPSEIGAFAVFYALVIGFVINRKLGARSFYEGLRDSLGDIGAVMFLIALSAIMSYGIVFDQIPDKIVSLILGISDNLEVVMVLIVVFLLIAGFVIDSTVLIIMLTPIFLPVILRLGGDPVHFGIVFIIAATIGNFTPPVGAAMYAVCSILRTSVGAYTREAIPFFMAVALVTLFLIFVPSLVLALPEFLFKR